jgi:hypothetical protein
VDRLGELEVSKAVAAVADPKRAIIEKYHAKRDGGGQVTIRISSKIFNPLFACSTPLQWSQHMQNKLQSFFREVGIVKHKIASMRHNVNVISQVCAAAGTQRRQLVSLTPACSCIRGL